MFRVKSEGQGELVLEQFGGQLWAVGVFLIVFGLWNIVGAGQKRSLECMKVSADQVNCILTYERFLGLFSGTQTLEGLERVRTGAGGAGRIGRSHWVLLEAPGESMSFFAVRGRGAAEKVEAGAQEVQRFLRDSRQRQLSTVHDGRLNFSGFGIFMILTGLFFFGMTGWGTIRFSVSEDRITSDLRSILGSTRGPDGRLSDVKDAVVGGSQGPSQRNRHRVELVYKDGLRLPLTTLYVSSWRSSERVVRAIKRLLVIQERAMREAERAAQQEEAAREGAEVPELSVEQRRPEGPSW